MSRHIALICPPFAAHLHTFRALGEELVRRGHRVSFVLNAGAPDQVGNLPVHQVPGRPSDPTVDRVLASAERPAGLFGTLRTISDSTAMTDQLCAGAPAILKQIGADAIIADQVEPAGGLLARAFKLSLVSLACALPINRSPGVPLPYLDWPYMPHLEGRLRRTDKIANALSTVQRRTLVRWSRRLGIEQCRSPEDCLGDEQIAQVVDGYDFPRPKPRPFAGVGPIRRPEDEEAIDLPFSPDPSRPLVFATMGTLQGGSLDLWRGIAEACRMAEAQFVIAHGGKLRDEDAAGLDADHASAFLPYRAVLRHASVCITHGGSNTVLDALACSVPLIVRPVAFDQPGNLARIVHHGLGERMAPVSRPDLLAAQIRRVTSDPLIRNRVNALKQEIVAAGGVRRAADIVEAAI